MYGLASVLQSDSFSVGVMGAGVLGRRVLDCLRPFGLLAVFGNGSGSLATTL